MVVHARCSQSSPVSYDSLQLASTVEQHFQLDCQLVLDEMFCDHQRTARPHAPKSRASSNGKCRCIALGGCVQALWFVAERCIALQVQTGMTESIWKNESHKKASESLHPLGRVGEPRDIARAVEFLLHPDSDFITGQILGVDGGMTNAQARE